MAIMGQPTTDATTSLSWSAHQFRFSAFLDPDGTVKQLDISLDSPSEAEKAALKCGEVRTRRSVAAAAAGATPPRTSPRARACALVSEAEMSAILGAPVVAEVNNRSSGKCIYKATSGISPYVELSVDWGDGKTAMTAMGMVEKHEPGLTNPYRDRGPGSGGRSCVDDSHRRGPGHHCLFGCLGGTRQGQAHLRDRQGENVMRTQDKLTKYIRCPSARRRRTQTPCTHPALSRSLAIRTACSPPHRTCGAWFIGSFF